MQVVPEARAVLSERVPAEDVRGGTVSCERVMQWALGRAAEATLLVRESGRRMAVAEAEALFGILLPRGLQAMKG